MNSSTDDGNLKGDVERQINILRHKDATNEDIDKLIRRECQVTTSAGVTETGEDRHGLKSCLWRGQTSLSCGEFAAKLLISDVNHDVPMWIQHSVDDDVAEYNVVLHHSKFHLEVYDCSIGALNDPFTFTKHAGWRRGAGKRIKATFDFDKDSWKVELQHFQKDVTHILQGWFNQIRKAFVVQAELINGCQCFTVFIYLRTAPFLSRKFPHQFEQTNERYQFERTTQLPDVSTNTIGRCSVLRLTLMGDIDGDRLMTMIDKLCTSQFNVWWGSIRSQNTAAGDVERLLDADETPWPIKWLLSEGYRIIDQLTISDIDMLYEYQDILYSTLKGLLARDIIVDVMGVLKESRQIASSTLHIKLPELSNYTLIPKVLVTPTRLIFLPPELVQFNRIMRKYNPNNFITVSFRDEDDRLMASTSPRSIAEPIVRIITFLSQGLMVGGRKYEFLGCSNSQLRLHGCWMYSEDPSNPATVDEIRHWMGDLSGIHCVALYVSRLGQFFSSSTHTIDLSGEKYSIREVADVERNGYCFTDGVGLIAQTTANEVAKQLGVGTKRSAYQIRLGGCKGVLTVSPKLPDGNVHIRPSMKKFPSGHNHLEVMEVSRPVPLYLNRQVITLLSQLGIPDDVFLQLLEDHLRNLMEMLTSNSKACEALLKMNLDMQFRKLYKEGVDFVSDPFFRSLILIQYEEQLHDLLVKTRIPVPRHLGRLLMGVADETGQLLSGEVFIKYSCKIDTAGGETKVVTGPVVITKNPCLHPGDLRVFKAVDNKELHHMVDCLVFPVNGERPHADEMSGSDLDGDMYWTSWHPDLIISGNHEPMKFCKTEKIELGHEPRQGDILNYIGDYIKNDQLGMISNAHLVQADIDNEGIFSEKCVELARLSSVAVDFSKSGVFQDINPELRPQKYPDFMMKKEQDQYDSVRILGKLHRNIDQLWDSLRIHLDTTQEASPLATNDKVAPDDARYHDAEEVYRRYSEEMQNLIDVYGLMDECHLLAGSKHKMKQNTLHKGDRHELAIIMTSQVRKLRSKFRKLFQEKDAFCDLATKSKAWHDVAYRDGRFRSFTWLAPPFLAANPAGDCVIERDGIKDKAVLVPLVTRPLGSPGLPSQEAVANVLKDAVLRYWPNLQIRLLHVDLSQWHIPGNEVYIKVEHSDETILKAEFAQLCSIIPNLLLQQDNEQIRDTSCFVTMNGIELTFVFEKHQVAVHVFTNGVYACVLGRIRDAIVESNVTHITMQVFTNYWMLSRRRHLCEVISPLHICHMLLYSINEESISKTSNVLYDCLRRFTIFNKLKELQLSTPALWTMSSETLRRFQYNILSGLQMFSMSHTHNILDETCDAPDQCLRKMFHMSANTERFLREERPNVTNILASRSNCSIEIKTLRHRNSCLNAIEGFGTAQKLNCLTEEVHHFENTVGKLSTFGFDGYTKESRQIVFEGSKGGADRLRVMPYKGGSCIKQRGNTLCKVALPKSFVEVCIPNTAQGMRKDYLPKWERLLENLESCYDRQLLGDLRIISRFAFFHFKPNIYIDAPTVGAFTDIFSVENSGKCKHAVRVSSYPANFNLRRLLELLRIEGLEHSGNEYKTVCDTRISGTSTDSLQSPNTIQIDVALDEDYTVRHLHHTTMRWGSLDVIRKMKIVPGQWYMDNRSDFRIQIQTMREISDWTSDIYGIITRFKTSLLQRAPDQAGNELGVKMPLLNVNPGFPGHVRFIRQREVDTYKYPTTVFVNNQDHFTANVAVHVSKVREYHFREISESPEIHEYVDATIVIPTVPPLHYVEEHRNLFMSIMNLSMKMSDIADE